MQKYHILLLVALMSTTSTKSASTDENSKFHKVRKSISATISAGFLGSTTGFFAKKIAQQIINPLLTINQHNEFASPILLNNNLLSPLLYTLFFIAWKCNEHKLISAFIAELKACDIDLNTDLIERTWNLTSASSFILS